MRKAYCYIDETEGLMHLGWFETRGKAKSYFANTYLENYVDIKVERAKWADEYPSEEEVPAGKFLENGCWAECCKCETLITTEDKYTAIGKEVYCERCSKLFLLNKNNS